MHTNRTNLYGCRGEVSSLIPRLDSIVYGIFLLFQLILSVFGNALVCIAIIRFRHLRTLTNSLIFSLAVTDLLTPFVRGMFIGIATISRKWIFGCFWCKLSSVLGMLLCASSIMHLCAISIERFIVIKWPLRNRLWINKRRIALVLTNIWVISLLLSLFPYFGLVETTYNFELLDCEISWTKDPKMAVILAAFFFIFPFIIMSLTNVSIFRECQRQTRRLANNRIPASSTEESRKKTLWVKLRIAHIIGREFKAVKIIAVVIGVFFVLWLPIFIVTCVRAYLPRSIPGGIQRIVFGLAYFNSSCNWIIYSVMNRELRNAFKRMLSIRTASTGRDNVKQSSNRTDKSRSKVKAFSSFSFARKRKITISELPSDDISPNRLRTSSKIPSEQREFVSLKHFSRRFSTGIIQHN